MTPADAPDGAGPVLADQAARRRISDARDETLFVEAGAGSGKTRSLVDRVLALVASGVEMRHVAAITFTEKAAAELRERIRRALEQKAAEPGEANAARFRAAVEQVDAAAVSTLHAFAQRILTEHPLQAGLPPNVEVLDEVASELEFQDRWTRFRDRLFADQRLERCLLLAYAAAVGPADLRQLAAMFDRNWDLVGEPGRVPWRDTEPPAVDVGELLGRLDALLARRSECDCPDDRLYRYLTDEIAPYTQQLRDAPDELETLRLLRQDKPTFAGGRGRRQHWDDKSSVVAELEALGQARGDIADGVACACLRRLAAEIAGFTLDSAQARRARGRLEFHDLLVLARELLRSRQGPEVRDRLRRRYQRLLLDEMQDTDPIQIELAVLIASTDPDAGGKPWQDTPVEPGSLFFVGDPKQSIYRFRRADMRVFLEARRTFGQQVSLTTNFRATPPLVEWVNHVFGRLIAYEDGSQPEYQPIHPDPQRTAPPTGPAVAAVGRQTHERGLSAADLREREAEDVAEAVLAARGWRVSDRQPDGGEEWRDARLGDITILLPARTSLPALERALDDRGVAYRAETSSLVYATREVRELMAALRAVADPTDQLSLVTALRSPLFGCGDDDLFTYAAVHGGHWSILAEPPDTLDGSHPVVAALAYLSDLREELDWLAPSELLDRIVRERRLFELGYARGRPRDLWRRLRFVIDQARAWSEARGGSVRQYLEWARLQASESVRAAETILPETDDDSVRIMTVHAAKGLEFPIAIVSGLTTAAHGPNRRIQVAFPDDQPVALKVGSGLVTPEFEDFRPVDEQMDHHERVRLLYVACTRAQDHLVVSLHRTDRAPQSPTNAELLADACRDLALPAPVPDGEERRDDTHPGQEPPAESPPGPSLPERAAWDAQRAAALHTSGRRRSLGASDIALHSVSAGDGADDQGHGPADETAAGAAKQPRDLELPAWQKGRYGTAVGRAVHAVLQTLDLATGEGLAEAVAAQAAAEGVVGREADVRRLVRAAVDAPVVAEALRWPRWRETYVATQVDDRTVEGYVDLLFRTGEGLVIVDYKTASSTADLDRRVDAYRPQGGAYALAVEGATGEPVARVVFVFLTPAGPVQLALTDLDAAKDEVHAAVTRPADPGLPPREPR